MPVLWRPLPQWGSKPRKPAVPKPVSGTARNRPPRRLNYTKLKEAVLAQIASLSAAAQAKIPLAGTLPEIMVALALVQIGWQFQCQSPESGARLRLGGSVVDFVVVLGATKVIIRVNGDYWHTLPGAAQRDAMQEARLSSQGYLVVDLWEQALYEAWDNHNLRPFVEQAVLNGR
jgi:G:T-mismatch repair DNA endonuclease (very short patch repair protein)